jgi:hypothetical protein
MKKRWEMEGRDGRGDLLTDPTKAHPNTPEAAQGPGPERAQLPPGDALLCGSAIWPRGKGKGCALFGGLSSLGGVRCRE